MSLKASQKAMVPFVSVDNMMRLIHHIGIEIFLSDLAREIEADFARWDMFDKTARVGSHSDVGVIELMPTSDGTFYGFKYVNGHPKNMREGLQTVTAFGVLSDVYTGYPVLFSEMTVLTALRTGAASALASRYLAHPDSQTVGIIGCGAQAVTQAHAVGRIFDIDQVLFFDIDAAAAASFVRSR